MPTLQRRPRHIEEDDDDARGDERPRQRQRRDEADSNDDDESMNGGGDERDESTETQLVKKLVRYALACEYSRTPIRRDGIREKVLGPHGRSFKKVFEGAQKQLQVVFGMQMVELPVRDKSTLSVEEQRRAAKSQTKGPASTNTYILVTTIPEPYRSAVIIPPSKIHSSDAEAIHIGLYTLIIGIITLNGGELSDHKLKRYLQRVNANINTPLEKTEVMLQRLIRQGYVVKTVERSPQNDEDAITWHVGPRGKQEVTHEAIAGMAREVYGAAANDDLERKLQVSLRIEERKPRGGDSYAEAERRPGQDRNANGAADGDEDGEDD
ncbi:hypothetical protein MAPG_11004 [Magnaporthiopsis poae ATCC 64411]|uniref:MAGE domain-containing protein n=1 Tax=Magnaporthiopsis poae (strain ATCC 64411 / 73-15) TaxID=644358 RepID=A0A0C4EE39_MAGP6|nr:hypothetical protein MAPG_11004 [Magnaporthiopsis poae ATCC 64411]